MPSTAMVFVSASSAFRPASSSMMFFFQSSMSSSIGVAFEALRDEAADVRGHFFARLHELVEDAVGVEGAIGDEYRRGFVAGAGEQPVAAVYTRMVVAPAFAPRERTFVALRVVAELEADRPVRVVE